MFARALMIVSFTLIAALSGCVLKSGEESAATDTMSSSPAGGNQTTNATGNASSAAPTIMVSVLVNGTAANQTNGSYEVPAGENITFDASNSTGVNLTFAWDFGDGNTSADAVTNYSFAAAGNVTVNITITDEGNETANASLALVVASSGPAAGTALGDNKLHKTGTYTAASQNPAANCVGNPNYGSGQVVVNAWDIPTVDAATGATVLITKIVVNLAGGTTTIDQGIRVTDPAGKNYDMDGGSTGPNGSEALTVEGEFAGGAWKVTVYGCIAVNGSWTLDATATLVAA